jgi:hypothetical protein
MNQRRLSQLMCDALRGHLAGRSPRPPDAGLLIWRVFGDLAGRRTWHAHGPNPISHGEIEAYCRVMRLPLAPHHVDLILALDRVWLEHSINTLRAGTGGNRPEVPQVSQRPLSPDLFDAMTG